MNELGQKRIAIVAEAPLAWHDNYQCQGYAVRGSRRLSFVVVPHGEPQRWTLIAIETDANATHVGALFDDHSHHEVGSYPSLPLAKVAGGEYLAAWEVRVRADACPCGEIPDSRTHVTVDERGPAG